MLSVYTITMLQAQSSRFLCVGFLIIVYTGDLTATMATFDMDRMCGQTINMVWKAIYTAELRYGSTASYSGELPDRDPMASQHGISHDNPQSCDMGIQSWNFQDRIMFHFNDLEIGTNCTEIHLEVLDGPSADSRPVEGLPRVICGNDVHLLQSQRLATSGRFLTVRLFDQSLTRTGASFSITVVSFHEGKCQSFEYACASGRCIMAELTCNGFNPCGDYSDCALTRQVPQEVAMEDDHVLIISIIAICTVVVVSVAGSIVFYKCYRSKTKNQRRQYVECETAPGGTEATGTPRAVTRTQNEVEAEVLHSPPSYDSLTSPREPADSPDTSSDCSCIEPTNPQPPSYACVMTHQEMFHLSTTSLHREKCETENVEPT